MGNKWAKGAGWNQQSAWHGMPLTSHWQIVQASLQLLLSLAAICLGMWPALPPPLSPSLLAPFMNHSCPNAGNAFLGQHVPKQW